jgi:hypothetical protein
MKISTVLFEGKLIYTMLRAHSKVEPSFQCFSSLLKQVMALEGVAISLLSFWGLLLILLLILIRQPFVCSSEKLWKRLEEGRTRNQDSLGSPGQKSRLEILHEYREN